MTLFCFKFAFMWCFRIAHMAVLTSSAVSSHGLLNSSYCSSTYWVLLIAIYLWAWKEDSYSDFVERKSHLNKLCSSPRPWLLAESCSFSFFYTGTTDVRVHYHCIKTGDSPYVYFQVGRLFPLAFLPMAAGERGHPPAPLWLHRKCPIPVSSWRKCKGWS